MLVHTEEQQLLRDSAQEFLAERGSVAHFRALRDAGNADGFDQDVWQEMAELGWPGILIAEEHDGLDFGLVGAGILSEEMGRNLTCSPLMSTAVVGAQLLRQGNEQHRALLTELASGDHFVALAVDEGAHHGPHNTALEAMANASGFTLNGSKCFVVEGRTAHTFIVAARTSGQPGDAQGVTLFLVDANASGVSVTPNQMVDYRAADRVTFDNVHVATTDMLGPRDKGMTLLSAVLDAANCMLAAELLGIAEEAFRCTVAYMKERKQFGVPIGSFQALQHRAAHLYSEIECTRSVVLKALQAAEAELPSTAMLASLAKAKACATAEAVTNEAIQMHGGIGMTDEYDIGFYIKRARVAQQTYGDYGYHAERLAGMKGY